MRGAHVTSMVVGSAFAVLGLTTCGRSDPTYSMQARGGTYVDGTGRLGLAVLATIRDEDGVGPSDGWTGSLTGPAGPVGGSITYSASGAGSWFATWWPEEPPFEGGYRLEMSPAGGGGLSAVFDVGSGTGIAPPQPSLADDGASLSWNAVPGAAAYECRVYGEAGVALRWLGTATNCDLSALSAGSYTASVLAYSAELAAIAASASQRPALPVRLDVSEARLALSRTDGSPPGATLGVAGGAFHDGTSWPGRGLAVWVSILNPDATPTALPWTIDVVGPGLTATAPMRFTYPANFSRIMVWSADVPATQGSYGLVARSSAGSLARPFTIGTIPSLDAPTGIVATAGSQGSASVEWSAVSGAASYLVTVRNRVSGGYAASQWVAGTTASFPAGMFVPDETYDVLVAATDADMVGGAPPTQFAITENTYQPVGFVAR